MSGSMRTNLHGGSRSSPGRDASAAAVPHTGATPMLPQALSLVLFATQRLDISWVSIESVVAVNVMFLCRCSATESEVKRNGGQSSKGR